MQIAGDLGYPVVEREISRSELYLAEEMFLCGTAAELVPVREIDDHDLGSPGEITKAVQSKFEDALHGRAPEYSEWLDVIDVPSKVAPRVLTILSSDASTELPAPRPRRRGPRGLARAQFARSVPSERRIQ